MINKGKITPNISYKFEWLGIQTPQAKASYKRHL